MRQLFLILFLMIFSVSCYSQTSITLTPDNFVLLRDEVTSDSVNKTQRKLLELSTKLGDKDIIYLVIDSPGGSVVAGMDMLNMFSIIPQKIHTITIFAASMAFMISQQGEKRFINNKGIMMGHRARGGFKGQFEVGEVESQLNLFKAIVKDMEESVAKRMGLSIKEYKDKIINEMWLYDKNAVKENAADELITLKCSKELLNLRIEESSPGMNFMGFQIGGGKTIIYSGCPLLREPIGEIQEQKKDTTRNEKLY